MQIFGMHEDAGENCVSKVFDLVTATIGRKLTDQDIEVAHGLPAKVKPWPAMPGPEQLEFVQHSRIVHARAWIRSKPTLRGQKLDGTYPRTFFGPTQRSPVRGKPSFNNNRRVGMRQSRWKTAGNNSGRDQMNCLLTTLYHRHNVRHFGDANRRS